MKINIFKIQKKNVQALREKLGPFNLDLKIISSEKIGEYQADFFFSEGMNNISIPWAETYSDFFEGKKPENKVYFACYLWESEDSCFVLSYGKCHFYLRQFCDHDFGISMAKRIANEKDVKQKSSKKFVGRKKKEIRSYAKNSQLDVESGESIDYLQASILKDETNKFGKSGKFGSSLLISLDIGKEDLPELFRNIVRVAALPENFSLPRTTVIDNTIQSQKYEEDLIDAILNDSQTSDLETSSHEMIGVDFVFSGNERYSFLYHGKKSEVMEDLSIDTLREFIIENSIPKDRVSSIAVEVRKEDSKPYTRLLKEFLEYSAEEEGVILSQGKWMQFNEDYLTQLDEYIDQVEIEETEESLLEIGRMKEGDFNASMVGLGYENADKDFGRIKVFSGTPVEAWDLSKDDTVYAVKIGKPQKLGYVCDQSVNTLELIKKKANIQKLNTKFSIYCLWMIFDKTEKISKISEIKSIIFKQKIESWARKCIEFRVVPKLKISYIKK
jgi:uncharacterized protein (TIGR04141 family)